MTMDLGLIFHTIDKKRAPIEAQLSPILSTGEFVTNYDSPATNIRTSILDKFKWGLLKCLGISETSSKVFNNKDWNIRLGCSKINDYKASENLYRRLMDNFAGITAVPRDYEYKERESFYKLNDLNNANNSPRIGMAVPIDFQIASSQPVLMSELKAYFGSSQNIQDPMSSKKHHFKGQLEKRERVLNLQKMRLTFKESVSEIAEKAARMALVRSKSKAAARTGAIITAAYARMNTLGYHTHVDSDTIIGATNQTCPEMRDLSPMSKGKIIDYETLLITSQSAIFIDYSSFSQIEQKEDSSEHSYSTFDDPQSYSVMGASEINDFDDEQYAFSTKTRNWLKLLMSSIDSLGRDLDSVQIHADEFSNGSYELDNGNQLRLEQLDMKPSKIGELDVPTDPTTLDDSWIDVFLSQINDNSPSLHGNSDEITSVMSPDTLGAIRDFYVYPDSDQNDNNMKLGSQIEVDDKIHTVRHSNDCSNISEYLYSPKADIQENTGCFNFDDHVMDFSKAHLCMEEPDSQLKETTSQVDTLVSGILKDDIVDRSSSECLKSPFVPEWDRKTRNSKNIVDLRSENCYNTNTRTDVLIKELLSQIDAMLPEREPLQYAQKGGWDGW